MTYIEVPFTLNPQQLIEEVYEEMEARFPGWKAGGPEDFLVRAVVARLIVPLVQLAADVPDEIFHKFGVEIINLPPIEATSATAESTWKMVDTAGYTIDAGTEVGIPISGDTALGFRVVTSVTVPEGSDETNEGEVLLEAIEPGKAGNELSGIAELEDALSFVEPAGITLVGESSGGADAEDPTEYLSRLAETMKTLAPRPIIANDVSILARNVAGVYRVAVLDLFDPEEDDPEDEETWDSERHVTIAPHDESGNTVSATVKEALEAEFQAKRESNFVFHVIDPTYTTFDVDFKVIPAEGFEQTAANASTVLAIKDFLDPAKWGIPADGNERIWVNQKTLRYQDLVTVVNNVKDVDHYTELKIGPTGEAKGTVDLILGGAAPLPKPGTIEAK